MNRSSSFASVVLPFPLLMLGLTLIAPTLMSPTLLAAPQVAPREPNGISWESIATMAMPIDEATPAQPEMAAFASADDWIESSRFIDGDNYGNSCGEDFSAGGHMICDGCGECWSSSDCCCCPPSWWVEASAVAMWTSGVTTPLLATSSTDNTVPQAQAAIPGQASTRSLFGGSKQLQDANTGFRIEVGHWFDNDFATGFDFEFVTLGTESEDLFATTPGTEIIGIPYLDAGVPAAYLIAYPGDTTGSLRISNEYEYYTLAAHGRKTLSSQEIAANPFTGAGPRRSLFGFQLGPRFIHLDDGLSIQSDSMNGVGDRTQSRDSFHTSNRFHGVEFGLYSLHQRRYLTLDMGLKIAAGLNWQDLNINGSSTVTPNNGAAVADPGGVFAQLTNIGSYDRTRFSFVPQADIKLGYRLTETWKVTLGYNVMYWDRVARASEQIDTTIDSSFIPGAAGGGGQTRPGALFNESGFLAHGLSFGLEKRW